MCIAIFRNDENAALNCSTVHEIAAATGYGGAATDWLQHLCFCLPLPFFSAALPQHALCLHRRGRTAPKCAVAKQHN
jgi:hypothetical protein